MDEEHRNRSSARPEPRPAVKGPAMKKDRTNTIDQDVKLNMQIRAEKLTFLGLRMHGCKQWEFAELAQLLFEASDVLQLQIEQL